MSPSATDRYGLRVAPAGLALVQEFLNTREIATYGPDLLADADDANAWLGHAVGQWRSGISPPQLAAADLRALRQLRALFLDVLEAEQPVTTAAPVAATLVLGADGTVQIEPRGTGAKWLASALWAETLLAQHAGTWQRLKLCRAELCRSAFYDGSRNNSGVWHDVTTCGNRENLRASRARKRS